MWDEPLGLVFDSIICSVNLKACVPAAPQKKHYHGDHTYLTINTKRHCTRFFVVISSESLIRTLETTA